VRHVLELPDSIDHALNTLAQSEGVSPRALLAAIVLEEIRRRIEVKKTESTEHTSNAA
jgi:hypothetical protein